MSEQTTEFDGIIEHLSDPLKAKKASFLGCLTGMLLITWMVLMPAIVWAVYGWAF